MNKVHNQSSLPFQRRNGHDTAASSAASNGAAPTVRPGTEQHIGETPVAVSDSPNHLTVLLVAPHEQAPLAVDTALRSWPAKVELVWVARPDQAVERAQTVQPRVVLVDDELDGADPVVLIRQLVGVAPNAVILLVVDEQNAAEARRAVLAGARTFITKPLDAEDLTTTLRQLLAQGQVASHPPVQAASTAGTALGHVVVFCGPKGGTGRTTMMANTSVALHRRTGQRVVLVDADFSAPALDVALNLRDELDMSDLASRINRLDDDVFDRVLAAHASGVQVLMAPPPGEGEHGVAPAQIDMILTQLRRRFDWVMVDLGLPLDDSALSVLDSADRIIVSVLPEMVGLRNTRLLLEQFQRRKYTSEKVWLVLNRATLRGGVSRSDIEARLRMQVHHAIPDDQPLASYSVNRGVPLVLSHPRSAVARAVQELARHLVDELAPGTSAQSVQVDHKGGPISRLLGVLRPGRRG